MKNDLNSHILHVAAFLMSPTHDPYKHKSQDFLVYTHYTLTCLLQKLSTCFVYELPKVGPNTHVCTQLKIEI